LIFFRRTYKLQFRRIRQLQNLGFIEQCQSLQVIEILIIWYYKVIKFAKKWNVVKTLVPRFARDKDLDDSKIMLVGPTQNDNNSIASNCQRALPSPTPLSDF